MAKWPVKAGSAPSTDEIAKALLAAAELTGERETLSRIASEPPRNTALDGVRARWPAIVALNTLYPRCHMDALGPVLGVKSGVASVLSAKRATWWPTPSELNGVVQAI